MTELQAYYKKLRQHTIDCGSSPEEADALIEAVKKSQEEHFDYTEWRRTQDWYENHPDLEEMHEWFPERHLHREGVRVI